MKLHPIVKPFQQFRVSHGRLFAGEAHGVYLANRLVVAFQAGWDAREQLICQQTNKAKRPRKAR